MNLDAAVTTLDPAKAGSYQSVVTAAAMYDPLVANDNGKIIPDLAASWTTTTTTAVFTIRTGVTCSDGEKLTGSVVAASLNRFFDPATAAPLLSNVIGSGNTARATASGQQVTITLAHPYSALLDMLTVPGTGIVCSRGTADPAMLTTKSDGTGGYVAAGQVAGSSYTFTRRNGYNWGPVYAGVPTSGARPAKLVMKVVTDENTRANLQLTGQMQIADYSTTAWERAARQSGWTKTVSQQSDTFLMFNQTPGHLTAEPAVRKAIAEAVDLKQLNQAQSFGAGEMMYNLGRPTDACYNPSLKSMLPQLNLAAAKQVLAGKKISVLGTTILADGDGNSYLAAALQSAGAHVSLSNLDNQTESADLLGGKSDWDVSILVLAPPAPTMSFAAGFFSGAEPPGGTNFSFINDPDAVALLKSYFMANGAAACATMTSYQRELFKNFYVLPLTTVPVTVVLAPGVTAQVNTGFILAGTIRVASK